jgi:NADPH2:quinone reductase
MAFMREAPLPFAALDAARRLGFRETKAARLASDVAKETTMKVARISRFGGPEVLEIAESPTPTPGPGQVLVRVERAGVNLADALMRENRYAVTPELPAVLGHENAGVVERLGDGVSDLEVGTRVAAPLFASGSFVGGYAEYVSIDAHLAVPLPDELPFEDATALVVQGLTALALTQYAPPRGKTVLVSAAAGGVGTLLVQLARRAGAKTVIAAASTDEKLAVARSLGASAGVNYTGPDWPERLLEATGGTGPDIVYESVGGSVTEASLKVLAPRGQLVVYGALNIQRFQLGVPELLGLIFKNQSLAGFAMATYLDAGGVRAGLSELFALAVSGALRVRSGGVFPLARVADAHRALQERRTIGKIVLVP